MTSGGLAPTGTVDFYSGTPTTGRFLGAGTVTSGVATLQTAQLTTADTSITAAYLGDGNYLASTSPASAVTITQAGTQTAVTVSPVTSGLGSPVVLTATVSVPTPGSGVPTGSVEFFNGATMLGTQPLTNGTATLTTSSLPLGNNSITATYEADTNFTTSTSSPATTATVINASLTTVSASPTSGVVFGESVTLTATVTPAVGTTPVPTGNVQFLYGTTPIGTPVTLSSSGIAVLNTTSLPTGVLSVTAVYQGDSNYGGSTSPAITVNVGQAWAMATLTVVPNPSGLGQSVTLMAALAAVAPGAGTPTGMVQFFNGTTSLGTMTLSTGVASLSTTALPLGANSITAVYSGDMNFSSVTSQPVVANVEQAATTTLVAAPTTVVTGQPVMLTATVAGAAGLGTPTGMVNFFNNGTVLLGTGTLDSTGTANLTTMFLAAGTPSLTAVYLGDSTFGGVPRRPSARRSTKPIRTRQSRSSPTRPPRASRSR